MISRQNDNMYWSLTRIFITWYVRSSGQYELHSCVTHKGRSADSGHYIGWVRQEPGSNFWWKYDDEIVTETTTEEVMKLKGGGDRDTAYLMFYRFKTVKSL